MAKISLVLVISLVVALPWRWAVGQEDPWKSLADQAASQGISQQSIDDAQAALRTAGADSESSVWADWIKGTANNMGYTDENAPTASADGGSASDEPEAEDFADIGVVDESSPADAESPAGASPKYSPSYAPVSQPSAAEAPQAQAPGADTPQAYAPHAATPEAEAPAAATPEAYSPGAPASTASVPSAAAPEAQTPSAAAPGAYATGAATPVPQANGAAAPTSEAEAPEAVTPTAEAPLQAAAPDAATSPAQAPEASSPEAA